MALSQSTGLMTKALMNKEKEKTTNAISSSSPTTSPLVITLSVPTWWVTFYDIPVIDQLPTVLQYLCLAYADYQPKEIVKYPLINRASFYTQYFLQIQYHLTAAANELLSKGKIDIALALIKTKGKEVLNVPTEGRDRFGTYIEKRTLLQMAGMLDDVNHREKQAQEKDHGAVELLSKAAGFNRDEVADQLFPVLFSEEAKAANNARKNTVLALFKEFGESLIRKKAELPEKWNKYSFEEFKITLETCRLEIDTLRKNLFRVVFNQTITLGQVLDSSYIIELDEWFRDPNNLKRFEGLYSVISDLFWFSSYGLSQYVAMASDARVHRHGIGRVVNDKELPARTLENWDGSSVFAIGYSLEFMCEPLSLNKMDPEKLYITTKERGELVCYVREGKEKNEISLASLDPKIVESIEMTVGLNAEQTRAIFDITSKKGYCPSGVTSLGHETYLGYYAQARACSGCAAVMSGSVRQFAKFISSKNERVEMLCNQSIRSKTLAAR